MKSTSIYTYYKDRLIEISGRNRCICLKTLNRKSTYDLGRLFEWDKIMGEDFISFLFGEKKEEFAILNKDIAKKLKLDKPLLERDAHSLRSIAREIDEIEKETGRYELYVGFPFVVGTFKDVIMKGPLFLFPVKIEFTDEFTVSLTKKAGVSLNKALVYAYANAKRLRLDELETEFIVGKDPMKSLSSALSYLTKFGFKFEHKSGFLSYDKLEPIKAPEILDLCTLGRYSFANSVYADYAELEKKHLTNEAIDQLLNSKPVKAKKKVKPSELRVYTSHYSDFAQSKVISEISEKGNMVIYGPPGTGKSQTIVNIISDAVLKNKKVLVVSQKKAALDVVYNRLGEFGCKAMYIIDAEKEKKAFYDKCFDRHKSIVRCDEGLKNIDGLEAEINKRKAQLEEMSSLLSTKTEFGLSPSEMYSRSYMIGKNSSEYAIYRQMLDSKIMKLRYDELNEAVMSLKSGGKAQVYYDFCESKKKNPCIDYLKQDLDIYTVSQAKTELNEIAGQRQTLFNKNKYPYARQLLAYIGEFHSDDYSPLVKMTAKLQHPKAYKARTASYALFPMLPITLSKTAKIESELEKDFAATKAAVDEYLLKYGFLTKVLTSEGYYTVADHLISGNTAILKLLLAALESYVGNRDIGTTFDKISPAQKIVLEFAYANSGTPAKFHNIIDKVLTIRIYHELLLFEGKHKNVLHKLTEFDSVRGDILRFNAQKNEEVRRIALKKYDNEYLDLYESSASAKDYLYQISKKQNYWPIRKTTDVYGDYLFRLFPCWLLSPENVSTILPLKKNLFDIILFDEASQIFIENTLPVIFRGKHIVVAGDSKQLRPTSTFMKRYMGGDPDEESDYSTQAALEVESLLDLAVSRYDSCNLTYHYRSRYEELIDFSSRAFYSNELQISPNTVRNKKHPIERIKVDGKWIDRRNLVEAEKVVELLKKIFRARREDETIGIITFNVEQEEAIENIIDRECFRDEKFRSAIIKERARKENGEDVSLFVKNIENVQGDERDIIIFSIGYAYNEAGRMVSSFGSLSVEGGENRLNVLITRAKKKIYVVTSIEPEDLKTESKNLGPKLFRKYLEYVRAVSDGNIKDTKLILDSLCDIEEKAASPLLPIEDQMKAELEKLGYKVEVRLGNSKVRISLAVYDPESGRYLVGVQTEEDALRSSASVLERDVYVPEFLESRGWHFMRVWNRDWWLSPHNVIAEIANQAEKARSGGEFDFRAHKKSADVQKKFDLSETDFASNITVQNEEVAASELVDTPEEPIGAPSENEVAEIAQAEITSTIEDTAPDTAPTTSSAYVAANVTANTAATTANTAANTATKSSSSTAAKSSSTNTAANTAAKSSSTSAAKSSATKKPAAKSSASKSGTAAKKTTASSTKTPTSKSTTSAKSTTKSITSAKTTASKSSTSAKSTTKSTTSSKTNASKGTTAKKPTASSSAKKSTTSKSSSAKKSTSSKSNSTKKPTSSKSSSAKKSTTSAKKPSTKKPTTKK